MRTFGAIVILGVLAAQAAPAAASRQPAEDAVYVYGIFKDRPGCRTVVERLKALPLRPTLLLSIDDGSRFLLDEPDGRKQVGCALEYLRSTSRTVKVLVLQDVYYLDHVEEASRRAGLVRELADQHPRVVTGMHVDVEPHTMPGWGCMAREQRRSAMRALLTMLGAVRGRLRGLPLGLSAAWWYPTMAGEVPEAAAEAMFKVADEIYLMFYGDPGGPLVAGSAERVLSRLDSAAFPSDRGRLHLGLAAYEFRSSSHLQAQVRQLHRRLRDRPNFGGTAVFHAHSQFNAPLVRHVSGTVVDASGVCLADVEIEVAGKVLRSDQCGQFGLAGVPEKAEIIVRKQGYRTRKVPAPAGPPGSQKDLGKIELEKE